MSNFDIKFDPVYSDDDNSRVNSFNLTFMQKDHDIALGFYVVYPRNGHNELTMIPKFRFSEYKRRFEELALKIARSAKETEQGVKAKNRKYFVTEDEVNEARMLRSIISHSHTFKISGPETTISLPGKFLEMLAVKDDFLTFVQIGSNEYTIINPNDAWMYSDSRNFNYSTESDSSAKAFFNRLKKAM